MVKLSRNDPCSCGSGKKYKQCCINSTTTGQQAAPPMSASQKLQLAHQFFRLKKFQDAETVVKSLLKLTPMNADLLHFLAGIQSESGQHQEALAAIQKAIKLSPSNATFQFTLGAAYANAGQQNKAISSFREAVRLNPRLSEAWFNLGNVLLSGASLLEAVQAYQAAIASKPDFAEAHSNLGDALKQLGRLDDAIASYQLALQFRPGSAQTYSNLGLALQRQGKVGAAIDCFAKALVLQPDFDVAASNQLMAMQYFHGSTADQLFAKHWEFGRAFEAPLKAAWQRHANLADPNRRLKLGYVSPDLRAHSVATFIGPILHDHDHHQFEVYCYYSNSFRDKVTDQIEADADHWVMCGAMSDDELANKIRSDGIDILVDLSGHTAGNRLLTFARKPAPVQVTWMGYPGTTGLSAMDYRLSDPNLDPVGVTDAHHTEVLIRLPSMAPFTPSPDSPPVNELPAMTRPFFTFASLNNVSKLNEQNMATWSAILRALPHARLILGNAGDAGTQQWLTGIFAQFGIASDRLVLKSTMSKVEYLALHNEIDLGLDPYPWNGGTTTLHSLWMGVPVVTLRGDRAAGLQGASTLSHAGLPQFIANDEDEYVQIALRYANDLPALNEIRQQVRSHMASAYQEVDANAVRPLEQAYRDMWLKWCEKQTSLN